MMSEINLIIGAYLINFQRQSKHIAVAMVSTDVKLGTVFLNCFSCSFESFFLAALNVHFEQSDFFSLQNVVNAVCLQFKFARR